MQNGSVTICPPPPSALPHKWIVSKHFQTFSQQDSWSTQTSQLWAHRSKAFVFQKLENLISVCCLFACNLMLFFILNVSSLTTAWCRKPIHVMVHWRWHSQASTQCFSVGSLAQHELWKMRPRSIKPHKGLAVSKSSSRTELSLS